MEIGRWSNLSHENNCISRQIGLYLQLRIKYLNKHPIIRSISAVFILLVMALSITPKIVLHDWFADHQDVPVKKAHNEQAQVSKQLFNCNCDNIVAESPFTDSDIDFTIELFSPLTIQQELIPVSIYSSAPSFFSLRGPPASC